MTDPLQLMLFAESRLEGEARVALERVRAELVAREHLLGFGIGTYGRMLGRIRRLEWHWRGERRGRPGLGRASLTLPQPSVSIKTPFGELWICRQDQVWAGRWRAIGWELEEIRASQWLGIPRDHVAALVRTGALRSTGLIDVLIFRARWNHRHPDFSARSEQHARAPEHAL